MRNYLILQEMGTGNIVCNCPDPAGNERAANRQNKKKAIIKVKPRMGIEWLLYKI